MCDNLYYLLIFSDMRIGLVRRSGPTYVVWTEMFLAGAIMSFLVTGMGRRRIAGARPEQYLGIWQAEAESRRSNPIMYVGRHCEFLIRRCLLPYALLAFAVVNVTKVAFILSVIGVNVVWFISLYSYCAFAAAPTSPATDFVGPA